MELNDNGGACTWEGPRQPVSPNLFVTLAVFEHGGHALLDIALENDRLLTALEGNERIHVIHLIAPFFKGLHVAL